MIQNQFQAQIQILRTDNGREYFHFALGTYLMNNGIIHQSSCVDTPQQNGVAEQKNKHLLEVSRSIMFTSNVPKHFWGEVVLTTAYLINKRPSRTLNYQSLCQVLQSYPNSGLISSIPVKVFGCTTFVHIHSQHRSKPDPKAVKCLFLGYSPSQKGYKGYSPTQWKIYVSMDVTFFEIQPFYPKTDIQGENGLREYQLLNINTDFLHTSYDSSNPSSSFLPPEIETSSNLQSEPISETIQTSQSSSNTTAEPLLDEVSNDLDLPIALRKGMRSCTKHPIRNFVSYNELSPSYGAFAMKITEVQVPTTIHEALSQSDWKKAVFYEMSALEKTGTWKIVDLPQDKNKDSLKLMELITKRHLPQFQNSILLRVLLSLAANLDWLLNQLDVKNVFLNGDLEKEVYMEIPLGFKGNNDFNKIHKGHPDE
ncbi:Retrovirus-related Pol polyprotein from transposon TNT 1-94 [Vitis vinifera]|uniref:Retrovirus-related Pol polyprotein from transposon TNT 1-94 n=1 Tax=Vitis vinifera TaxID=29760 RepID=A0A438FTR3_VITVI|nr:Retrovirus-related Pol polyprotein from transposon TNT 1-94 [Vitis vinifera]